MSLHDAVITWPTPTARDYKDSGANVDYAKVAGRSKLAGVVAEAEPGYTGALNPDWVEWLMGFPIGWTRLEVDEPIAIDPPWAEEPPIPRMAPDVLQRSHRLKALGNAVVPQVAELLGRRLRGLTPGRSTG